MHELSIAMSIVEGAAEEARRHPGERVAAVHLRLGELSGVVRDALLFSYDLACEGTPLTGRYFLRRVRYRARAGIDPEFLLPGMREGVIRGR
jgi:hydrogenase nickel incorporation protein HypA/HybF